MFVVGGPAVITVIILMVVLGKKMPMDVPVCYRHRGYWFRQKLWVYLPLVVIPLLAISVIAIIANGGNGNDFQVFAVLSFVLIFLAWLIVAAVIQRRGAKAKIMDDDSMTLIRVHQGFVDAFEASLKEHPRLRRDRDSYNDYDDDYCADRTRRRRSRPEESDRIQEDPPPPERDRPRRDDDRYRDRADDY